MQENEGTILDKTLDKTKAIIREWVDVDVDEQEYLDRLSNFGEGYFDFSTFDEAFGQSGETQ